MGDSGYGLRRLFIGLLAVQGERLVQNRRYTSLTVLKMRDWAVRRFLYWSGTAFGMAILRQLTAVPVGLGAKHFHVVQLSRN